MKLHDLQIYQISDQISDAAWVIYQELQDRRLYKLADQLLSAADSIGANIAEAYGRYYYLDVVRFYYNSRGSLWETVSWIEKIERRKIYDEQTCKDVINKLVQLNYKLNALIKKTRAQAE